MPDNAGSCFAGTCCARCCAGGGTSTSDNNRRRLADDDPRRRDYDTSRDVTVQPVVMSQIRPPPPQIARAILKWGGDGYEAGRSSTHINNDYIVELYQRTQCAAPYMYNGPMVILCGDYDTLDCETYPPYQMQVCTRHMIDGNERAGSHCENFQQSHKPQLAQEEEKANYCKTTMCGPDDGCDGCCCMDDCCGCLAGMCCASCCLAGASAADNDRRDRRDYDSPRGREVYVQPVVVQQGYPEPPPPGYGPPPPPPRYGYGPPPPHREYY